MSILDQMVSEHHSGPVVLSENHDAGKINWVAGLSDPGEMIGCGMYQQLRRNAGESDDAYQERLTVLMTELPAGVREQIETAMKAAALKRANLDTSTGRVAVMVAGKAAWHTLGVRVASAVSSADAIRLASLNWRVAKVPLSYTFGNATKEAVGTFGIVRQDTGAYLGPVGNKYQPIQNEHGFAFLDGVLKEFGAKYETAGAINGGRQVWMLVHLPKQAFKINSKDAVEPYAIFTNSHDGTGSACCYPTTERVVCGNTFRIAQNTDKKKGTTMRHTGSIRAKMGEAARILTGAVEDFATFKDHAEAMARIKAPPVKNYLNDVLDAVMGVTVAQLEAQKGNLLEAVTAATEAEAKLKAKEIDRKLERRGEIIEDMLARYESERCGTNGTRGTVWSQFNAVTEHADHNTIGRKVGTEQARTERRFESAIHGDADAMKQLAYAKALTMAV